MTTFCLPDLGEGLQEAEILDWHVSEGDHVTADQPLVSVETDKAVIEIPAPASGRITRLFAKPGDVVPVGGKIVEYDTGPGDDAGAIVGDLETGEPEPEGPVERAEAQTSAARPPATDRLAAPAVRMLAKDLGVDLGTVTPTGTNGEITRADVRKAAASASGSLTGRDEKLRGVRRAMAIRMHEAGRQVVPATLHDDADIGAWPDLKNLMPRMVRALAAAAMAEPALNAWYSAGTQERTLFEILNVGIAVDTDDGLIVPVLKDAASIPQESLPDRLKGLIDKARDRTLQPDDLRNGTMTISNFGAVGGRYASLVVVPPQVAILGVGRARGNSAILPLSLTIDHRAVSGGEASRFLAAVIGDLEND